MKSMKALTLRHPWPFAICHMGKYRVDGDLRLRDILIGGIVATAVLDRVVEFGTDDICERDPWFDRMPGNFGWTLRDVIVLPEPIPCRGSQGLWDVNPRKEPNLC